MATGVLGTQVILHSSTNKKKSFKLNIEYHKRLESLPEISSVLSFSSIKQTDVCHKVGPLTRRPVRSQHLFLVIAGRWCKASTCFPWCKVEVPLLPPTRLLETHVACLEQIIESDSFVLLSLRPVSEMTLYPPNSGSRNMQWLVFDGWTILIWYNFQF